MPLLSHFYSVHWQSVCLLHFFKMPAKRRTIFYLAALKWSVCPLRCRLWPGNINVCSTNNGNIDLLKHSIFCFAFEKTNFQSHYQVSQLFLPSGRKNINTRWMSLTLVFLSLIRDLFFSQLSPIVILTMPVEIYQYGWQYTLFLPALVLVALALCYIFLPILYQNNLDNCYTVCMRWNKQRQLFLTLLKTWRWK